MTISKTISKWYQSHARNLPWRKTKDPYLIWISEVVMQQTRVEQGMNYYLRFIETFPNIKSLSHATEDQVLKLWEGLGYYSRARNLMAAAKQLMEWHQGVFPNKYEEVIKLKGIGPYTAAAITSFAFDLKYAVLDGNVFRVLSRYYGVEIPINTPKGQKYFSKLAQEILDKENPATHNQAMMEFGALHCKPANPLCTECPLNNSCIAYSKNKVNELPRKEKKLVIKNRHLHFFYVEDENNILIEKRDASGIWKGLYQLPLIESKKNEPIENILLNQEFKGLIKNQEYVLKNTMDIKHKLTHRNLFIRFYHVKCSNINNPNYLKVNKKELGELAFPRPVNQFLKEVKVK